MAEPALKLASKEDAPKTEMKPRMDRKRLRLILLFVLPLVAAVGGLTFYLYGGRYITTDNAYVGAQKVLITPDISGKIAAIYVKEGERVEAGQRLFEIDSEPFRLTLAQSQGKLGSVRVDFDRLKANLASLDKLSELARKNVEIKQRDVERKSTLVDKGSGTHSDLDTALAAIITAELQAQYADQQVGDILSQLLGDRQLPIERFPAYVQAKAALDQAQRDLDHTLLQAPISGVATQVDAIQLGRFVTAGTPVFAMMDDTAPWVEANPKETDITFSSRGAEGRARRRFLPRPHVPRQRRLGEPRHRCAILDPAGTKRERELGESRAAGASADRLRPH